MDAISQLQQAARAKRDAAIQAARDEYDHTMGQLSQLGRSLGQRVIPKARPVAARRIRKAKSAAFRDIVAH
jgi:hypothetical protein